MRIAVLFMSIVRYWVDGGGGRVRKQLIKRTMQFLFRWAASIDTYFPGKCFKPEM